MPTFETTEEFLARGGKLTRVPPGKSAHISVRDWHRAVRGHGLAVGAEAEEAAQDFAHNGDMDAAYNSLARVDSA